MEDLLRANHVNLMLVGHQHAYERSCAVYQGECTRDGKGTVHIVVGSAGFELDSTPFSNTIGNWSVSHANEYGFLRVSSTPTQMHIEFVKNRDGGIYDHVVLEPWP